MEFSTTDRNSSSTGNSTIGDLFQEKPSDTKDDSPSTKRKCDKEDERQSKRVRGAEVLMPLLAPVPSAPLYSGYSPTTSSTSLPVLPHGSTTEGLSWGSMFLGNQAPYPAIPLTSWGFPGIHEGYYTGQPILHPMPFYPPTVAWSDQYGEFFNQQLNSQLINAQRMANIEAFQSSNLPPLNCIHPLSPLRQQSVNSPKEKQEKNPSDSPTIPNEPESVMLQRLCVSKSPVLEAVIYCALNKWGIELITTEDDQVAFKVLDFDLFSSYAAKVNSKTRPTADVSARVKALRRWFDGIPKVKARTGSFIMTIKNASDKKQKVAKMVEKMKQIQEDRMRKVKRNSCGIIENK